MLKVLTTLLMSFVVMVAMALPAQAHVTRCIPKANDVKLSAKVIAGTGTWKCYSGAHHEFVSVKATIQMKKGWMWYNMKPVRRIESERHSGSHWTAVSCFKGKNKYRLLLEVVSFGEHGARYRKDESDNPKTFTC